MPGRKNKKPRRPHKSKLGKYKIALKSLRLPLLLFVIAFLIRLLVLIDLTDSPIFYNPIIDSKTYHDTAREIAAGNIIGQTTFWQAPLYQYFLGLIYWLFGVNIFIGRLVGIILGAVNCCLIFYMADKIFSRRVAWMSYGLAAIFGPFIFFETELLAPALLIFLFLLILTVLLSYLKYPATIKIILVGLLLGVAQVGHGLAAIFLPFLIGWLIYYHRGKHKNVLAGFAASLFLIIGFLPMIILTVSRNYAVDGELVLVSSNVGTNFYLGNHPNYDSTTAIRPGIEWDEFTSEASINGYRTPAQESAYYTKRAVSNIINDIPGFISLLFKKLYLLTGGEEIKRNLDIYYFKKYSIVLNILIWRNIISFPSGIIIPLALCGILLYLTQQTDRKHRLKVWLLLLIIISQSLAIIFFFVASRYRIVMMPFVIIIASYALFEIADRIRGKRLKGTIISASLLIILLLFCNLTRVNTTPRDRAENYFYEGVAYLERHNYPVAVDKFKEALEHKPNYAAVQYNLALAYQAAESDSLAEKILNDILRQNKSSFVVHLLAAKAFLDQNEPDRAEELFKTALKINPFATPAYIALAGIYQARNNDTLTLAYLNKALEINPKSYKAYNQLAAYYTAKGQPNLAELYFRKAVECNPFYAPAVNNLAIMYSRSNRVDRAEQVLEKVIKLEPNNAGALMNFGGIKLQSGKPDEALEYFNRAVEQAPTMPQIQQYRGMALYQLGRRREAAVAFREALRIDSTFQPAREWLKQIGY
jgi:Tfp pilus assembly protein PilF